MPIFKGYSSTINIRLFRDVNWVTREGGILCLVCCGDVGVQSGRLTPLSWAGVK